MELFRKQVIERRGSRLLGEVSLASPVSTWVVTWLIGAIVAVIALALLIGGYARKEIVQGWIKPDKGLVRVVSPLLGTVETVHVVEGQIVNEGDSLVTLNLDTAFSAGEGVYGIALAEMETQITERENLIPLTELRFAREALELEGQMDAIQAELSALEEQRQVLDERILTAGEALERITLLAKSDAASTSDVDRQREAVLSLRQSATQVKQQIEIKKGESAIYRLRLEGLPANEEAAITELREGIAGLRSQRAQVSGRGTLVMAAPVSGRVAALPLSAGQSVRPQQMTVALLPEGGRLEAELFVPTRAAGFIQEGQHVRLQFDAFPFQRYGIVEGKIILVSRTIFDPSELPVALGVSGPVYRVLVSISVQHVDAYGERFPLQTGMTLSAHIVLEERKLWEVLLDPLLARI